MSIETMGMAALCHVNGVLGDVRPAQMGGCGEVVEKPSVAATDIHHAAALDRFARGPFGDLNEEPIACSIDPRLLGLASGGRGSVDSGEVGGVVVRWRQRHGLTVKQRGVPATGIRL